MPVCLRESGNKSRTTIEGFGDVVAYICQNIFDRVADFIGMYVFDVFTFKSKRLADVKERAVSNRYIPRVALYHV